MTNEYKAWEPQLIEPAAPVDNPPTEQEDWQSRHNSPYQRQHEVGHEAQRNKDQPEHLSLHIVRNSALCPVYFCFRAFPSVSVNESRDCWCAGQCDSTWLGVKDLRSGIGASTANCPWEDSRRNSKPAGDDNYAVQPIGATGSRVARRESTIHQIIEHIGRSSG